MNRPRFPALTGGLAGFATVPRSAVANAAQRPALAIGGGFRGR